MSDLIITPSSGKIDFIYQSGQEISRLESITIDPTDGLVFSGKISASSVNSPLNITATSSNINYPFIFASSGETGAKSLLMDSAGGTYNPSTNLATVNISGTSSWATNTVTNANLTGDVTSVGNATTIANSVVTNAKLANSSVTIGSTAISLGATASTIAGLTSVTSTTFVGALTGTATTASYANALNAANSYTVVGITGNLTGTATTASYANNLNAANQYTVVGITGSLFGTSSWATNATNALQLGGTAAASYVTLTGAQNLSDKTITGTFTGALTGTATTASYANALNAANSYTIAGLTVNGNFAVNGSLTVFSASNVYITSSNLVVTDNIITMNALSPYQRYAGIQMYDTGSGTLSNFLWDGDGDYFFLSGSSVNGKIITGPDSQANLTANFVPKATAGYKLGNSLIYDNGTSVGIGTTTVNQKVSIYPGTTGGISLQDIDSETRAYFFIDNTNPTYSTGIRTQNYYLDFDSSGGSQNAIRFYTGTSTIGTGTERMRIISNGNVGIGTNTPGALFEISSSTVASLLNVKGAGGNGLLFVSGSGNVGIGTTSPAAKLQVNSTTAGATLLRTDGTNGTLFSVVDDLSDSLMSVNNSAGLPVLEVFADDRIVMGQYGQNDFVLVNNKVGIGTNNPVAELHVTASSNIPAAVFIGDVGVGTTAPTAQSNYRFLQVNGTNSAIIETMVGGARIGGFDSTSNTLYVGSIGSYPIVFRTAVDEKMRIAANGNVGIGTSSPAQKLEVQSGSVLIRGDGTALFGTYYASAGENTFFTLHSGSGNTFHIGNDVSGTNYTTMVFTVATDSTGGNVGIGTTNPVAKLQVAGNISGSSFTSSISNAVGFLGTSSWASNAVTSLVCTGNAATATTASYANALNAANSYTVTGITGALTGNVTGTATTASYANALNAANKYTVVGITGSLFGTSSWATNATNALQLGGTAAASYVTLTGAQNLSEKTITGTFTGALTGTATTASYANALNAANSYTVAGITGNLTGTATTASYANALNAANSYTVAGITGALTGNVTGTATTASYANALNPANNYIVTGITGALTGNVTGTATTASYANALNAANRYTVVGITGSLFGTSSWASNAVTSLVCTGNAATATTASYANALNAANSYTVVGITGALTGNVTGTATTASYANALNAANQYTVGGITGSHFGTSSWATNAVTALNVGNGTITIAGGTGVGVGSSNTFTTNQSGATTVTITNTGVTSAVAGTGVSVTAATGPITFSIGQAVGTTATPTFASVSATTFTGTATTASYANALNAANSYTVTNLTASNIYATDGALFNFKAQRIPLQGAPQQGTHKGYLILAKAYTSGNVDASYVIGKVILRRGTSGTGHDLDIYEVNSSRGYNTEIFQVSRLGTISTRFLRLVKVTYGGVVYHAIETSNSGGQPSTEMYFEGSIIDSPLILTDETFVSSVSAFGNAVIFVDGSSNVGIGTTSPLSKLHISGSGQTIMRLDSDTTTNVSQFQIKAASDAVLIMGMLGGSATGNNYGVTAAGQAYIGTTTLGTTHPTSLVIGNVSTIPTIFSTNNVERMRIDGTGLVGIGTTVPSTLLHAYGSDGRYFTYSGTSGAFTIQRNAITTGGATPVLSLINTQGMDASTGRGTSIQLDLGYGGSSSVVGTAARGARIATLGETVYDATAANQNAVLAFFTSTAGSLTEKLRIRSDGSLSPITVSSTTAGATLLRTDGTNGTLFSVVDDLSDSLMSVNNSAGLPVLEVFADDRIVAGQYGQNDFVVVNNKVGIGTNNPLAKLHVTGSSSVPAAVLMGNVGIGTTSFVYSNANRGLLEIYGSSDALISLRNDTANSYLQKSGNDFYFNNGGAGFISIATNGSERMYIKSDGNVGIGTSVPLQKLHVLGNISTISQVSSGEETNRLQFYNIGAATYDIASIRAFVGAGQTNRGELGFYVNNGAGQQLAMYIDRSQNVGIGIAVPTTPLHVVGVISGSSFTGAGTGLTGTAASLTAGTATTASYANALNAANSYTVTGITGALTGNVTGTATTASYANALNAANRYTVVGITGSLFGTSSWATNAVTALNGNVTHTGEVTGATGLTIADSAVITARIANAAVTNAKLATDAVTDIKITDGTISNQKLVSSAVTVGTTSISLGNAQTTIGGLVSVTSNAFAGPLTGNVTGNVTGTATTASYANALNAANTYTVTNLTVNTTAQLKGVKETYVDVSHVGNVVTIDLNAGTVFRLNYNAQISSFTISNLTTSKVNSFTLISIPNTGAGGINFTFTSYTLVWAGNSVPYATQTGGKFDVFSFIYDGSRWYGFVGGLNY